MSKNTTTAASGGIGFFGVLIVLGVLGLGPCAKHCTGCGPTLGDVLQNSQCKVTKGK